MALLSHQTATTSAQLPPEDPCHLVPPTQGPKKAGPRLTLQRKDHHFLHSTQLVLCQALVLSCVIHLWGAQEGVWRSGEEDEGGREPLGTAGHRQGPLEQGPPNREGAESPNQPGASTSHQQGSHGCC